MVELAPIEDAKAMVETGIDFLAAGIGNIHGPYPANWKGLHLDHLQNWLKLFQDSQSYCTVVQVFLMSKSKRLSNLVVAKVNVNTECQIAFANATRKFARDYEANEAEYDKKNSSTHVNSWLTV